MSEKKTKVEPDVLPELSSRPVRRHVATGSEAEIAAQETFFVKEFGRFKNVVVINQKSDIIDFGSIGDFRILLGSHDDKDVDFTQHPNCPRPDMTVEVRYIKKALENSTFRSVFLGLMRSRHITVHPATRGAA